MLKKSLILTVFLIALQCLFTSVATASTIINNDSSDINSAQTWTLANSPYIIEDNVTIGEEGSLTIQPGVVVKFKNNKGLYADGTLNAQGTVDKPIYFTDYRDDAAGGDTNADISATSPVAGSWSGIRVGGTGSLNNCVVRYAGYYNDANIYKIGTEPLTLTNTTLSNSSKDGLRISNSDGAAAVTVNNCKLENNAQFGIYCNEIERDSYTGTGNTFTDNKKAPICIDGGTLYHNVTWNLEASPYYIRDHIAVDETAALTVSPGVVVKFAQNKELHISGTLNANGNSAVAAGSSKQNTIYFTDYRDDAAGGDTNGDGSVAVPAAGWWGGIRVDGTGTLNNCVVRYAGYYNDANIYKTGTGPLTLTNTTLSNSSKDGFRISNSDGAAAVTVNNCTIENNKEYGVRCSEIDRDSYTGTGNIFTNNSKAPVCIEGGTLKHNVTWNIEPGTYYISDDITIDDAAALTINSGVVVKFAQSQGLYVSGTLTAKGDPNAIYFTDYRDDLAGGDTTGDGSATMPVPGWWGGIVIRGSGTATLDNCVVRYAGYYYDSNIYKNGIGSLNLTNSEISNSSARGLAIIDNTGTTKIAKNKIFSNKIGVSCDDSNPVIGGSAATANQIYSNTNFGVENKSTNTTVNAKYNWWGDATGPTHATNPLGKGDKVSNGVDFGNFLTLNNDPDPTLETVTFDPKTNIQSNKSWTIKFSQAIYSATSLNTTVNSQNITVVDDQNNPISVTFSPGGDLSSVIVNAPTGGYVSGKTYTILVKNIKAVNGEIISEQYSMKFTIA